MAIRRRFLASGTLIKQSVNYKLIGNVRLKITKRITVFNSIKSGGNTSNIQILLIPYRIALSSKKEMHFLTYQNICSKQTEKYIKYLSFYSRVCASMLVHVCLCVRARREGLHEIKYDPKKARKRRQHRKRSWFNVKKYKYAAKV